MGSLGQNQEVSGVSGRLGLVLGILGGYHSLSLSAFHRLAHISLEAESSGESWAVRLLIPAILFFGFLDTRATNPRVSSLTIPEQSWVEVEVIGKSGGWGSGGEG